MSEQESLIEYPSRFPIKVMGTAHPEFSQMIFEVVRVHAPDFTETDIEVRMSSGGNYVSLTITITAVSKEQLDNVYRALTGHPLVKYVL
jgi:putative lipoic acid-binding regulatory protein